MPRRDETGDWVGRVIKQIGLSATELTIMLRHLGRQPKGFINLCHGSGSTS